MRTNQDQSSYMFLDQAGIQCRGQQGGLVKVNILVSFCLFCAKIQIKMAQPPNTICALNVARYFMIVSRMVGAVIPHTALI